MLVRFFSDRLLLYLSCDNVTDLTKCDYTYPYDTEISKLDS